MVYFTRTNRTVAPPLLLALIALSACASTGSQGGGSGLEGRGKNKSEKGGKSSPSAENARLKVERDRLVQANRLLEQELAEAHEDLRRVERQFAIYEERLASENGKASSVASSAEARIRCEKLARERPDVLPDSTLAYVKDLIDTSERLIQKQNYAAAQFFAERANHTMSSAERRATVEGAATTRKVTVEAANVREGPGQSYPVVERLSNGARLLCWGEANEWYHVRTAKGAEGWIHASLVR